MKPLLATLVLLCVGTNLRADDQADADAAKAVASGTIDTGFSAVDDQIAARNAMKKSYDSTAAYATKVWGNMSVEDQNAVTSYLSQMQGQIDDTTTAIGNAMDYLGYAITSRGDGNMAYNNQNYIGAKGAYNDATKLANTALVYYDDATDYLFNADYYNSSAWQILANY